MNFNKLALNDDKTKCLPVGYKTAHKILGGGTEFGETSACKYLGVWIDSKFSFQDHVLHVSKKVSRLAGIISRLRHFVSPSTCLAFYNFYIKPVIQYGVLIYGCASVGTLSPIFELQKKVLRMIYFKPREFPSESLFRRARVLSVYNLHVYDLFKFSLKGLNTQHCSADLNSYFNTIISHRYNTRARMTEQHDIPKFRTTACKQSLKYRGTILLDYVKKNKCNIRLQGLSDKEMSTEAHRFQDNYLLLNQSYATLIFD